MEEFFRGGLIMTIAWGLLIWGAGKIRVHQNKKKQQCSKYRTVFGFRNHEVARSWRSSRQGPDYWPEGSLHLVTL